MTRSFLFHPGGFQGFFLSAAIVSGSLAWGAGGTPAQAGFAEILAVPKSLVDYAIEARSASDIARDNELVLQVNSIMAELGTLKASTEVYEQRLLVTGVFDDKALYDRFLWKVKAIPGLKHLYWHVQYVASDDPRRNGLLDWGQALLINTRARARLIGTMEVSDVNYRVATDAFGVVYALGLARSASEKATALRRLAEGDGVRKVVDYIEVRP